MVKLVGILNITPDSFSDGGVNNNFESAVINAEQMYRAGASIIDIGAESTRPGAKPLEFAEEVKRLEVIVIHASANNWQISLDSYHPETIYWANKKIGNFIINDVTGFSNPAMIEQAVITQKRVIISHLPRQSRSIKEAHDEKPIDSDDQVIEELNDKIEELEIMGVAKDKIIADPGIGFGKTPEVNWQLLEFAKYFPDYEVMIGYSRKRFFGENRMDSSVNIEAGKIAVSSGAAYLRVHDVAAHSIFI
jgi:dihydropteroate synthase